MNGQFDNVANLVKTARLVEGISQSDVSKKVGYKNAQFISNVERGLCSIPRKNMLPVSRVLKIDPEALLSAMVLDYSMSLGSSLRVQLADEDMRRDQCTLQS